MFQPQMLDSHRSWDPWVAPLALHVIFGTNSSNKQVAVSPIGVEVLVVGTDVVGDAVVVVATGIVVLAAAADVASAMVGGAVVVVGERVVVVKAVILGAAVPEAGPQAEASRTIVTTNATVLMA